MWKGFLFPQISSHIFSSVDTCDRIKQIRCKFLSSQIRSLIAMNYQVSLYPVFYSTQLHKRLVPHWKFQGTFVLLSGQWALLLEFSLIVHQELISYKIKWYTLGHFLENISLNVNDQLIGLEAFYHQKKLNTYLYSNTGYILSYILSWRFFPMIFVFPSHCWLDSTDSSAGFCTNNFSLSWSLPRQV